MPARGLVQQQQRGIGRKRAHDLQTALGAVRKASGLIIRMLFHVKDGEQLHSALVCLLLVLPVAGQTQNALETRVLFLVMQANLDVVLDRHGREQADVLERTSDAHAVDLAHGLAARVLAVEQNSSVCGLIDLGKQVEYRSLASTVGTDKTGDLGLADGEVKVIDRLQTAKLDTQVNALERRRLVDVAIGNDGTAGIGHHLALFRTQT